MDDPLNVTAITPYSIILGLRTQKNVMELFRRGREDIQKQVDSCARWCLALNSIICQQHVAAIIHDIFILLSVVHSTRVK